MNINFEITKKTIKDYFKNAHDVVDFYVSEEDKDFVCIVEKKDCIFEVTADSMLELITVVGNIGLEIPYDKLNQLREYVDYVRKEYKTGDIYIENENVYVKNHSFFIDAPVLIKHLHVLDLSVQQIIDENREDFERFANGEVVVYDYDKRVERRKKQLRREIMQLLEEAAADNKHILSMPKMAFDSSENDDCETEDDDMLDLLEESFID